MSIRDRLTPAEREIYDASYAGSIEALAREVREVKASIILAMPPFLRRLAVYLLNLSLEEE